MENYTDQMNSRVHEMIRFHLDLDEYKCVSYLPLSTVKNVLGMSPEIYMSIARSFNYKSTLFRDDETAIGSGAIYVYDQPSLQRTLNNYAWKNNIAPMETDDFVKCIAERWFEEDDAIMPLVHAAFGD